MWQQTFWRVKVLPLANMQLISPCYQYYVPSDINDSFFFCILLPVVEMNGMDGFV